MLLKKINFVRPTLLKEIPDIEDYNFDIFVELKDGLYLSSSYSNSKKYIVLNG